MGEGDNSVGLIHLGNLTKSATVLIEKIALAIEGVARPWQTVRVAKAEAMAAMISARSSIEISDLEERALQRMIREETKKQTNIEDVTAKALPYLSCEAKPEELADDWLTHFFDKARMVSDADMQAIWARLLAEESNNPNSISRRTVDLASTFEKADAQVFEKLTVAFWKSDRLIPIVLSNDEFYKILGIGYEDLSRLDSVGLIKFQSTIGLSLQNIPKSFTIKYHDTKLTIECPEGRMPIGCVMLTKSGAELARICTPSYSDGVYLAIVDHFVAQGFVVWSPLQDDDDTNL
jgi:hypothetical protein